MFRVVFFACLGFLIILPATAENLRVGSVVSFSDALEEINHLFKKNYGHKLQITRSPTRQLYPQIKNSNDLDIAFLGDVKTAQKLEQEGLAVNNEHFAYAIGKVVLWSLKPELVDSRGDILKTGNFNKIALPDPKNNIYGWAAQQALINLELWDQLQPKIVLTANLSETQQKIQSGEVDLGFIALSLLNPHKKIEGSLWIVPKKYSQSIEQHVVLLKPAESNTVARDFLKFLKTPQVRNVIEKYGYNVP
ncbi:MAG: molybdate ABC transporter substrate-binding protein [Thiotrichaceae bacterium]|nr:molybdate ABC transporter substrate-binding protein [Thiotrichaceae bacterium]